MTAASRMSASERWFRMLLRLYPVGFREDMGEAFVETYLDRCRDAARRGGSLSVGMIWLAALGDSLRNGLGERLWPGVRPPRSGSWGRDGELAIRRLVRAPVFAASMVGTLTVGLGAFAVVYTVVDKILIEPLPYRNPDDLYFVFRDYTWIPLERGWVGGPDVVALEAADGVIEKAVAIRRSRMTLAGEGSAEPVEIDVMRSSPDLFRMLGVAPAMGRDFFPDEVGPARPLLVILGHDLWKSQFGGDSSVVGAEVRINDEPYTVIGVMGDDFRFVRHGSLGRPQAADAWMTLGEDIAQMSPGSGAYSGLVRARAGTPPDRVAAEIDAVARMLDERDMESKGLRLQTVGLKSDLVAPVRPALIVLALAGAFLVIVLLVNLATLLLARAAQREREFGIARALGANPMAIARATLIEGGLLGAMGGAGGALVAVWGTSALVALAPLNLPRRESIAVDWGIALVIIGVGAIVGLLAAAAPAVWSMKTDLSAVLRNASVRGGGGNGRMRRGMVVVQVALSLVLLSSGALVARSFERLLRADPGFDPKGVLTLRVPVSEDRYPDTTAVRALHQRLGSALAALPGVTASGALTTLPLSGDADQRSATFPGAPGNTGDEDQDKPMVDQFAALPGAFDALGIEVLAGRDFENAPPAGVREAVIDRTLAAQFFPTGNPVGARMTLGRDSLTVVGVVEHARLYDVHEDGRSQVYLRSDQTDYSDLVFALRTDRDPLALVPEARAAIRRVDAQLPVSNVRSMEQVVSESLRQQRVTAVLIGGFSLGALLLAAMGLFGVVSTSVNRRKHELAIRLALGADYGRVLGLVLRESARLIVSGMLIGIPGIWFAGKALRGLLVGVSPFDPSTLMATAVALGLVTLLACYVPARRIATIDPARALGEE